MSRGRRRRGGTRRAAGGDGSSAAAPGAEGARRSGGRRRRRRSGVSRAEPTALEQMANRGPRVLQTLPADGLVAEELIDAMREEYGYPATPQEYRLIVRVALDESERQNARRQRREATAPAEASVEAPDGADDLLVAPEGPDEGEGPSDRPHRTDGTDGTNVTPQVRRGRLRRRRRGRGRGGGASGSTGGGGGHDAGPRGQSGGNGGPEPAGGEAPPAD